MDPPWSVIVPDTLLVALGINCTEDAYIEAGNLDLKASTFCGTGSNATTSYSTCRPQLHAAGIGTYLEPISCEDNDLKMPGTQDTVYHAITQIGKIFDVEHVASQLIAEMKNDFAIAQQTLQASGHSLTAVWLGMLVLAGTLNCSW